MPTLKEFILCHEKGQKNLTLRRAYNSAIRTNGSTQHITAYLSAGGKYEEWKEKREKLGEQMVQITGFDWYIYS